MELGKAKEKTEDIQVYLLSEVICFILQVEYNFVFKYAFYSIFFSVFHYFVYNKMLLLFVKFEFALFTFFYIID